MDWYSFYRSGEDCYKKFPMAYLSSIELNEVIGQRLGVVFKRNGAPTMMSYVWMDRDR